MADSANRNLIGFVRWSDATGPRTAYLHVDGSWHCFNDPVTEKALRTLAEAPTGPQYGPFGPAQLRAAAKVLGGRFTVYPRTPHPPGTIY